MNLITRIADSVAASSNSNPIMAAAIVAIMWLGMNFVFATAEKVFWGKQFQHPLDVLLAVAAWAFYVFVIVRIGDAQ